MKNTWKFEKAKALRKYILTRFSKEGIAVQYNEYKKDCKYVYFTNKALNIEYYKTVIQSEKTIDDDIVKIVHDVKKIKADIFNAWGEDLDTKYLISVYIDFEDLMQAFVADKNRTALLLCWYHDSDRLDDIKKYEENIRNDYLDNMFGK